MTNPNQFGIHPEASTGHLSPEQAASGRDCVRMVFPRPVLFTAEAFPGGEGELGHPAGQHKIAYPKGAHQVPKEWADHWWLTGNGAVVAEPEPAAKPKKK